MAGYEISVGTGLLPGLLSGQDGLAKRVETVLNQILEAQMTETLGATRHERTDERTGYRNGYRPRTLYTRVGPVMLLVPQTRDGSFSTDIFKRYQRSAQAFVLALMEMAVQGVSTRKVSAITEELCGASFSRSTVSALCAGLEPRVNEEIRRRERVIRIFPNDASALRLMGALLAEQNEAWQERKYLDMDEFKELAASRAAAGEGNNVVALAS
ncbi:MAG: transposase [Rhodocyclales bacterium]|nr:transposase [Rhodocyclales bacterium]